MSLAVFEKLVALFDAEHAHYRVVTHAPVRTSEEAARVRGTALSQGARAMVCRVKRSSTQRVYVLAVLPADQQLDFTKVVTAVGGKKASLATPEEAQALTDCEMGAVPPVSFHPDLLLIADPSLALRNDEISFNAGLRERSIIMAAKDYLRIVAPQLETII
ncbi:MAG: YbaK/prolyl-tRNA synthetase associated domain-containing protein [Burkholderiales bacterium]|jgi:Ala-tRNA(Pro) deacylase|nr:YbaK/prolyl-tRNA synthetase associated domain-containing protein [Burkholderiales bacterium]